MDILLRENFKEREVYPYRLIRKYRIASYNLQDMEDVINEFPTIHHELTSGHFPFWFFEHKDPDFASSFFFTILRDPVERVLSHYQMTIRNNKNNQNSPLSIPPNLICKMLCSDPTKTGEALLQESIKNLDKMDFIIFLDDFESGVRQLFKKLHLILKNIPRKNTTEKVEVSQEIIQKIREMNDLDVKLYKYAVTKYKKKR